MGRRSSRLIPTVLGLALFACSPQASADPAVSTDAAPSQFDVHPVSGLKVIPVTVVTADATHSFRAELAETREQQGQGLMFRTELGPDEAMIFPSDAPTARSFWMKNTPISLDIIFIGVDGRILNIAAMTEPYSLESVYSVGSTSGVLEIAGGRAEELGIEPGDLVSW